VRRFQDISIRRKLTIIIMVASAVAILLVSAGLITYDRYTFRQKTLYSLKDLASVFGDRSAAALAFLDQTAGKDDLNALKYQKHITGAALYDSSGNQFVEYGAINMPHTIAIPALDSDSAFSNNHLDVYQKIYDLKDHTFEGTLYLESDLTEINERFRRFAEIVALFALVSLLFTLFLANWLQRSISRPIFHLAETTRKIASEKNYADRATKHGQDETGQLIDDFNEMLGQIQQRDQALQKAHDELEERVKERTRDLRSEIAERQRTETALRQQFVRISLLNQITHAISERQDTESIFHVVLRELEDHLGLDLCAVAWFDAETKNLNIAALHIKNTLLATQFDLQEGGVLPLGETDFQPCAEGKTVYLSDTVKEKSEFSERLAVIGYRSVTAVPLMVEEKLSGLLISARLEVYGFTSGDCEFLRMLSDHVALAAHQAKLYKELEGAYNELRQTQATVLQQERLKALGQMASGIAHDVNNALSPVVGFSELILKGDFGLNAKGRNYLSYISTAGHDIAHIIARLREFYRKHEEDESYQLVNLNLLVEQVVDMTRPRWKDIPQSNGLTIEVKTELAEDVPQLVGIESEIREAFTNLVLNAVDAMPEGGKITIQTTVCEGQNGYAQQVAVDVIDTGTGMSEETRKRCLEPFYSTKGKRGTGLGLAMVYGVLQRHEGNVEIQSEPGKGTTFRLTFPVRDRFQIEKEEEEESATVEPLRVLCIDDEPLVRELVKEMLERDGHQVEVSDNGQTGLDQFRLARERGRSYDVIITDLGMPYIDGRQVAKTIKQESPDTPVVMLTGWGALLREDEGKPDHVDIVLTKPPRSRDLRSALIRLRTEREYQI
jgi:signal transduction histidine kinase/ActR/RegA family two-component response regulator/HAMP domain-containing protein